MGNERCLEMDELLNSPLGVLVLARCITAVSGTPPDSPFADHLGAYPAETISYCLHELSTRAPHAGYFDRLSAEHLCELIVQCETDLTPFQVDYLRQAEVLLASGPALKPFVVPLREAPGTATWFADLDRHRQEWVSRTGQPPRVSSFHPDLSSYGAGYSKPRRTLWTTTSLTAHTSSWLQYVRSSGEVVPCQSSPYVRWRLDVLPAARVYEVHGPQDWNSLCLAYPAPSCMAYPTCRPDALIEPDWQVVSQDWDAVHLSVGGLLTTDRVRWGMPGAQTHLFGWDVESCTWLRWVFGSTGRLLDGE
jgi:hypothetical protein